MSMSMVIIPIKLHVHHPPHLPTYICFPFMSTVHTSFTYAYYLFYPHICSYLIVVSFRNRFDIFGYFEMILIETFLNSLIGLATTLFVHFDKTKIGS